MRPGLLGKKLGMTCVLGSDGCRYAVTVLKVEPHNVVACKTVEKHGYGAMVVGTAEIKENKVSKPMKGFFKAAGCKCYKKLHEFRVLSEQMLVVGDSYGVEVFSSGQFVDVTGVSVGKGFAGAMKRHNFGGLRATHGVSISHRSHGSIGNREDPGKVFKGKKMAGHMGDKTVTLQNLVVHGTDGDLLLIRGGVPGAKGSYVLIQDAIKGKRC